MENVNSVCFVAEILALNPISGADRIVQADISGWECVVQKDTFTVGDKVVIATVDAIIPIHIAEGLGVVQYLKHRKKADVYTVRTTKLKGVYSQALIVDSIKDKSATVGTDVMKKYSIFKYEEPEQEMTSPSGKRLRYTKNPNFHIYYKFPNVKNVPGMFTADDTVVASRKIHGTNARYAVVKKAKLSLWDRIKILFGRKWVDYEFVYGSHQVQKGSDTQGFYSTNVWSEIDKTYHIQHELWDFVKYHGKEHIGEGIIVYGEIYGPGIQKNYDYGERELKFKAIDVKFNNEYVDHDLFLYICGSLGLQPVDTLYYGKFDEEVIMSHCLDKFIKGTKVPEEGVVVKVVSGDRSKVAKWINPAYLLYQSDKDGTDFH